MTLSPPSQFGKRGVKVAPLKLTGPDMWTAHAAAVALGSVTTFNRADPTPSLKSLPPLDRPPETLSAANLLGTLGGAAVRPSLAALLFSANGRIGRRDYWLILTGALIAAVALFIVLGVTLPPATAILAGLPVFLVYLRVRACARIKRWHDRDKSVIWSLVGAIPFVGWIWAMVECGFLPGTPGANRYGLPPA